MTEELFINANEEKKKSVMKDYVLPVLTLMVTISFGRKNIHTGHPSFTFIEPLLR